SIVDGWQQIRKDLAYWRADVKGAETATTPEERAWFEADRHLREKLTLRDIGIWSHYVGDASQPLHVSVHFNGWGDFPNPNGYSQAKLHAPFEGDLVRDAVKLAEVQAAMVPPRTFAGSMDQRVGGYLAATGAQVVSFDEME